MNPNTLSKRLENKSEFFNTICRLQYFAKGCLGKRKIKAEGRFQ